MFAFWGSNLDYAGKWSPSDIPLKNLKLFLEWKREHINDCNLSFAWLANFQIFIVEAPLDFPSAPL